MVTSNKLPEKKVVKMAEQNNTVVVPQRTLLGEVNEHLTCPLCRGYYIDATTIVECLHSFCRSCIIKHLQVKSYCPECEMMINSARPNIKPDKALQDIVYKLVPGLFQREMERRQQFYASRPGPAACATPEQRGEDTERIIFSPEDVISFSLEFADATDTDSISSKSSDSNEPQTVLGTTRRFLQCPAVVNISHLKKFISMKFDIDSTQYSIDILYKRVPLPDYYTLMDIAYIYNWKRNEPMRFFYQITDYIAIRTRYGLFDINRKGSDFHDRKSSPTPTEETNASSPAPNLTEQGSEVSSGTDSPMPDDNVKKVTDSTKKHTKQEPLIKDPSTQEGTSSKSTNSTQSKKPDEDVEKSQFLNSFELTAKNALLKPLTIKLNKDSVNIKPDQDTKESTTTVKAPANVPKTVDDSLKRKHHTPTTSPEVKKLKIEMDKIKPSANTSNTPVQSGPSSMHTVGKKIESPEKKKEIQMSKALPPAMSSSSASSVHSASTPSPLPIKEIKSPQTISKQVPDGTPIKRPVPGSHGISSPKRKTLDTTPSIIQSKPITPLKLQVPKTESPTVNTKQIDTPRHTIKKMPDLKPSVPPSFVASQNKGQTIGKVRMDLLANNSDPTIDRSKILSQVKTSLGNQNPNQMSGDPLKSLFDSCKINIPSSLSITLTDQKDQRNHNDPSPVDAKKSMMNKNLSLAGTNNAAAHKVPSPPVHNYIEILKLPDADPKKQLVKPDINAQAKPALPNKTENTASQPKPSNKMEPSAKGPIPSLKPIADTKAGKSNSGLSGPITFQQTFEQQIQSIQTTDKPKLPKNKLQIPKLMPATPKALSAANKLNSKPNTPVIAENKSALRGDNALDLSTPHNIHSQLGLQQTKALETMQSIANLAKKQNFATKTMPQNSMFSGISNRPVPSASMPLRIPSTTNSITANQTKSDRTNNPSISHINNTRQDISNKLNTSKQITNMSAASSQSYQMGSHNPPSTAQPSPRQTRSPSSSPKLVIAEEKQSSSMSEQNINQSNQISSTQLGTNSASKAEPSKPSPGPSKPIMKPIKTLIPSKMPAIRPPVGMNINNPTDFQLIQQTMLRQTMEMHAWFKLNMSNQSSNNNDKH